MFERVNGVAKTYRLAKGTYNIVSALFPNWQGEAQTRTINKLTPDEFVNTNRNVAGGRGSASNSYRKVT